jgi:hypothetical protein
MSWVDVVSCDKLSAQGAACCAPTGLLEVVDIRIMHRNTTGIFSFFFSILTNVSNILYFPLTRQPCGWLPYPWQPRLLRRGLVDVILLFTSRVREGVALLNTLVEAAQ